MCWKDTCNTCKKYTWAGCGKHIDWALKGVDLKDRCKCKRENINAAQCECSNCNEWYQASSKQLLEKVFKSHLQISKECSQNNATMANATNLDARAQACIVL